jgi:hypothetical protein
MAHATSVAASWADLLTFIRNTCVANGWTLAGNVLHKGGIYVEIIADGSIGLRITAGNGIDGGNLLTGAVGEYAYLGAIGTQGVTFPLTAEVHLNTSPDEVYVTLNFATTFYELMAWGKSDVPGLTGTGVWCHATRTWKTGVSDMQTSTEGVTTFINFSFHCDGSGLFMINAGFNGSNNSGVNNTWIHADVDGGGWHAGSGNFPSAMRYMSPLYAYSPNTWNLEALLIPYQVYMPRTSGSKQTLVADLKHVRMVRIDYLEPGDIITLGPDKWKVYPWFRKDTAARDGGSQISHSGTLGYAVRYTGV